MKSTPSVCLAMTLLACGAPDEGLIEETGDTQPAILYAADTGGIAEGTPEALGVLKVANTVSRSDLQNKVGLTSTAASNINNYRLGDDGLAGTADDEQFDTLRELDAVPYINAAAFGKLLAYARANGYIGPDPKDPFSSGYCVGPNLTYGQARSRFAPATVEARLGSFTIDARERACHDVTGCSPTWRPSAKVSITQFRETFSSGSGTYGNNLYAYSSSARSISVPLKGNIDLLASASDLALRLTGSGFEVSKSGISTFPPADTQTLNYTIPRSTFDYTDSYSRNLTMAGTDLPTGVYYTTQLPATSYPTFKEQRVTNTCLYSQAVGREYRRGSDGKIDGSGLYTEYQVVIYGTYPASR